MAVNVVKLLEVCTVIGGFLFFLQQSWSSQLRSRKTWPFVEMTVLDLALALLIEWRLPVNTRKNIYRSKDAGLWCSLLMPAILRFTAPHNWQMFHCLVPVSLMVFLGQNEKSKICCVAMAGLVVYVLFDFVYLSHNSIKVITMLLMAFCTSLWYVPQWYPRSFTFGEVAMVTQLLTYSLYTSLYILYPHQPVTTTSSLDQIAGVVYVGGVLLVLCISQCPKLTHPTLGLTASVAMGVGVCLSLALTVVGQADLQGILVNLFLAKTSLLLLVWWIFCTVFSILLVIKYGTLSSYPHSNDHLDKAGYLYEKVPSGSQFECGSGDSSRAQHNRYVKMGTKEIIENKRTTNKNSADKQNRQFGEDRTSDMGITDNSLEDKNKAIDKSETMMKGKRQSLNRDPALGHLQSTGEESGRQAPLFVRKYFHLAMLMVYVPGLLYQPDLLYLASVGAAAVLVVIESVRVSKVPPFAEVLNQYLAVFLDQQDQGHLILTPVYLLLGCSLPLWMVHRNTGQGTSLSLYAGLISIGVGDSAASVIGRQYGRHKWPGSAKSAEGTLAAVIAQTLAVLMLAQCGVPGSSLTVPVVMAVVLSATLEAFSSQIDNLVVPLFTFMILSAV